MLNVIDNSGAAVAECINVLKMNRAAKVGKSKPPTTTTIPPSTRSNSPNLSPQATASSLSYKNSATSAPNPAPAAASPSAPPTKYAAATSGTR